MAEWSALQQAKSLLGTLAASMKDMKWSADPETVASRMEICEACPKLRKGKVGWRGCVVCGCGYKKLVTAKHKDCPLGKW